MNILRIVYEWPPPWGGLTPGPYEITRSQAGQGHHIRYLCGGWPRRPVEVVDGVRIRRLPSALPKLSLFASTAPAALANIVAWYRWADIIHGHQHLPVWFHTLRRWTGLRKPYVLHLHITAAGRAARISPNQLDVWTRRFEWPLHTYSDRIGCQVADAVICVSHSVKEEAQQYYGTEPHKLFVVTNGVSTEQFRPEGRHLREELCFQPEDKVILFVGVLTERKRPSLLIDALTHLPESWKLLIIGDGPLKTKLHSQAVKIEVDTRVKFTGFIPYPELPAYYRTADLFALVAAYEGYPKVVLEAAACGLPIMATRSFDWDELLGQGIIPVEEVTPVAIAQIARRAIHLKVNTTAVHKQYGWNKKAEEIQEIYEQLL